MKKMWFSRTGQSQVSFGLTERCLVGFELILCGFPALFWAWFYTAERSWKSRDGDSDVGGGRGRTEVVHHRQTSHETEENMPVGAGEFPVGELPDLQCHGYWYLTEHSYLVVLSLLPVQGNSCDFLHLLFKSANSHKVPAVWQAPWSV